MSPSSNQTPERTVVESHVGSDVMAPIWRARPSPYTHHIGELVVVDTDSAAQKIAVAADSADCEPACVKPLPNFTPPNPVDADPTNPVDDPAAGEWIGGDPSPRRTIAAGA